MENIAKNETPKREIKKRRKTVYTKIDNETRKNLVMMLSKKYLLKDAALHLNMNYSTAKTILRVFRNEIRMIKKKYHNKPIISDSNEKRKVELSTTCVNSNLNCLNNFSPRQNYFLGHSGSIMKSKSICLNSKQIKNNSELKDPMILLSNKVSEFKAKIKL